mmetsp:Transcript_34004/g.52982  ORF Transcript_34004/g.52982 Transcript_34004/m.52982 type:complete len:106 (-) Transcript_34004:817-1134(-)
MVASVFLSAFGFNFHHPPSQGGPPTVSGPVGYGKLGMSFGTQAPVRVQQNLPMYSVGASNAYQDIKDPHTALKAQGAIKLGPKAEGSSNTSATQGRANAGVLEAK